MAGLPVPTVDYFIKPESRVPSLDASEWPLLLKVKTIIIWKAMTESLRGYFRNSLNLALATGLVFGTRLRL